MKKLLFAIVVLLLVINIGCKQEAARAKVELPEMNYCSADSDCRCGGIDLEGKCFIGNKEMYEKYVDKEKSCPDFCTGIDGKLSVRCVEGRCVQMYECIMDQDCSVGEKCRDNRCVGDNPCKSDRDCVKSGCSGTICVREGNDMMTTCEYKEEYACYRDQKCGCVNGQCAFKDGAVLAKCLSGY